jgi:hypothetical protein
MVKKSQTPEGTEAPKATNIVSMEDLISVSQQRELVKFLRTNYELCDISESSVAGTDLYIVASWDGGNDSGWVSSTLEDVKDIDITELRNLADNVLNYGSWAGNFSSQGNVLYEPKENALYFEGSEMDNENRITVGTESFTLNMPDVPVDNINISITNWEGIDHRINVSYGVMDINAVRKIELALKKLSKEIEKMRDDYLEDYDNIEYGLQEVIRPGTVTELELEISIPNEIYISNKIKLGSYE